MTDRDTGPGGVSIAEQIDAVRGCISWAEYNASLYPSYSTLGKEANAKVAALRAALETLEGASTARKRDRIVALLAQWRPIATAPSDGRPILVFGGMHDKPVIQAADGEWWDLYCPRDVAPTHWRPLPPPPADSEKGSI